MKKYILTAIAVLTLFSLASCDGNDLRKDSKRAMDDVKDGVRDMTDGADRAADDITDGTIFDTDNNYNVDEYTANGTEMK